MHITSLLRYLNKERSVTGGLHKGIKTTAGMAIGSKVLETAAWLRLNLV